MDKNRDNKRRVLRRLRMTEQMEKQEKKLLSDLKDSLESGNSELDFEIINLKLEGILEEKDKLVYFITDTIRIVEEGKLKRVDN